MSQLWLVGMPGSGKTTVGRQVAERIGVPFHDTDELVESLAGVTVSELWTDSGESGFRVLEKIVVSGLEDVTGVIATGGGAVLEPDSRMAMKGTVVWLVASEDTIRARLEGQSERPLLAGRGADGVGVLILTRRSIYEAVADHQVLTDGRTIDEVVSQVVGLWRD